MSLLGRIGSILATLFLLSVIVFCLQLLLPGDPATILAGEDRSPETIASIRERFGLDQPLPVQYVRWLGNAVQGDLGMSMRFNQPVVEPRPQQAAGDLPARHHGADHRHRARRHLGHRRRRLCRGRRSTRR